MFENYLATEEDLEAIEEGIKAVWRKELGFIFKNKTFIEAISPLSFDSKFIYLYSPLKIPQFDSTPLNFKKYQIYKFKHKVSLSEYDQKGWCANAEKWRMFLPNSLAKKGAAFISGGLLAPFTKLQLKKRKNNNPYITRESYLATIVHEFAHVYFNCHLSWWFSQKKENLDLLQEAKNSYSGKGEKNKKIRIKIPNYQERSFILGEIFAFCTDYTAASLFWPKHKEDIDKANRSWLEKLLKEEMKKDLLHQNSVLDNPHVTAATLGKILLEQFPLTWPRKLINSCYL